MPAGLAGIIASAPRSGAAPLQSSHHQPHSHSSSSLHAYSNASLSYNPAAPSSTTTYGTRTQLPRDTAAYYGASSGLAGYAPPASTDTYEQTRGRLYGYSSNYNRVARASSIPSAAQGTHARRTMTPPPSSRDTDPYYGLRGANPNPSNALYGAGNSWQAGRPQGRLGVERDNAYPFSGAANVGGYGFQQKRRGSKVTLVLDLDETLVHSTFEPTEADLLIPVVLDGEHSTAYVKKRPHMEEFLRKCVEHFDVIVWTASLAVYAEPLINELCRLSRIPILKKMYRDSCSTLPGGGYVKDLTTLGRSLDDVCILDNSPSVARLQPKNLINIVSWYDDPSDRCLKDLFPSLERLAVAGSVLDVIPSMPGC